MSKSSRSSLFTSASDVSAAAAATGFVDSTIMDTARNSAVRSCLLWSCIARNDVILVEAGSDPYDGAVAQTAKELLRRSPTPGYEFHRISQKPQHSSVLETISSNFGASLSGGGRAGNRQRRIGERGTGGGARGQDNVLVEIPSAPLVRGIKFHVYEPLDFDDIEYNHMHNDRDEQDLSNFRIWVFGAVYDPALISQTEVQHFLEKIVELTIVLRDTEEWKRCNLLGVHNEFAPVLQQRMSEVLPRDPKVIALEVKLEYSQHLMARNIELLLNREHQLESLAEGAGRLQEMSLQFKKRARDVKRFQMMQNAKRGLVLGTIVSVGVGIVVVPPLIALL